VSHLIKLSFKKHPSLVTVLGLTILIYARLIIYGYISWDDPEMVFKNQAVKSFDLYGLFTGHFVGNYIPITMLLHAVSWLFFGDFAGGHHAVGLIIHLVNGILVFLLGKRLFKNDFMGLAGAFVFLLHPLQVESVAWIAELKTTLSACFFLLSALFYLHYCQAKRIKTYLFTLAFFIMACLSKPSAVVLPLCLICLDVILFKRLSFRFLTDKIPFFLLAVFFGLINIQTQTADQFINLTHAFPFYQKIGFAGYALLKYTLFYLWPLNLSAIYPFPVQSWPLLLAGYSFLLLIALVLIISVRRQRFEITGIIAFTLANLVLVLQFIPFGEVLYADRYMYLALIGFSWLVAWFIKPLSNAIRNIFIVVLIFIALLSFLRVRVWSSSIELFTDILKKYPDEFVALNSAGVESMRLNNDANAMSYLNKAVEVAPRNYKSYYNRGLLYLKNKKPELAVKSLNQSIELYDYHKAYIARASAYYMAGDLSRAMNDAEFVLQSDQKNPKGYYILGNCYNDLNKLDKAIEAYNVCIALNPDESDYYLKRAIVYGKRQDFRACLDDITICLALNPTHYEAYYWSGVAKINLKMNACSDFLTAAKNNFEPAIKAYNKYCR
jgi:protein O-mannosyl-transferase